LPSTPAARLAAGPAGSALDPEAEERRKRDEEEAARAAARAHGHPVTTEAFEAWRKKFEAEQALAKAQLSDGSKGGDGAAAGRVTGKAWFLAQMAAGKVSSSEEEEDGEEDAYVEVRELAGLFHSCVFWGGPAVSLRCLGALAVGACPMRPQVHNALYTEMVLLLGG
jgi:hypothetical protein